MNKAFLRDPLIYGMDRTKFTHYFMERTGQPYGVATN